MDADYPAAHSMDTHWFAVDPSGHVASFYSGEAGAVPQDAMGSDLRLDDLRPLLPTSAVIHDFSGYLRPGRNELKQGFAFPGIPLLLFLTSMEPVEDLFSSGRAIQAQATDGVAVLVAEPTQEEIDTFAASPHFRGCISLFGYITIHDNPSLAQFGFFEYHHLCENWISGPYGRQTVPAAPIHVDQLPPRVRKQIEALRIDQRFADTVYLQPVEFAECASWEVAYLDLTGLHERPIPGKEDEYTELYGDSPDETEA